MRWSCSKCGEFLKEPVILKCKHIYCQTCIPDNGEASSTDFCPQCEKSQSERELTAEADRVKGQDEYCKKHEESFSLFCKKERTLICRICEREHKAHPLVSIETAAKEYKEQLVSHRKCFQRIREKAAAKEGKYLTLLEKIESQKQDILSDFKEVCQILPQREEVMQDRLEDTIQDIKTAMEKNTKGQLLLDRLIGEINQKYQQQGIDLLKDIDSTLSRCEEEKGKEEAPPEPLTELDSRVQDLSESHKTLRELVQHFKVSLAAKLGFLTDFSSDIQRQVNGEDPTENVPNVPKQEDCSVYLLLNEDGKHSSDSYQKQEVVKRKGVIGHWCDYKCRPCAAWTIAGVVVILIVAAVLACSVAKTCVTPPDCPATYCPEDWIGYQGKCYFFSKDKANWTSSNNSCSSQSASLAGLDTLKEKDFLIQYKGCLNAWIGLRREPGQPWKWSNGSTFNLVQIGGGGECAYVYGDTFRSLGCYEKRNWICSKPDEFSKRKIREASIKSI